MLQECHKKYWESDRTDLIESVKRLLRRKKKESEQRGDTAIYIHLLFRLLSAETAREVLEHYLKTGRFTDTLYCAVSDGSGFHFIGLGEGLSVPGVPSVPDHAPGGSE